MHAVGAATQAGGVAVMLHPRDPRDVTLDPGYTWRYFFTQLVTVGLGIFFVGFGIVFRAIHRKTTASTSGLAAYVVSAGGGPQKELGEVAARQARPAGVLAAMSSARSMTRPTSP